MRAAVAVLSGVLLAFRCAAEWRQFRWVRAGVRGGTGSGDGIGSGEGSGGVGSSISLMPRYAHNRHWETAPLGGYGRCGNIRLARGAGEALNQGMDDEGRVRGEECLAESDEAAQGWIALLAEDVYGHEPISVAVFCPECARVEFGYLGNEPYRPSA